MNAQSESASDASGAESGSADRQGLSRPDKRLARGGARCAGAVPGAVRRQRRSASLREYSVHAGAAGTAVEVPTRPDPIEIRRNRTMVADHARSFAKGGTLRHPALSSGALEEAGGAVRNGAPAKDLAGHSAGCGISRSAAKAAPGSS